MENQTIKPVAEEFEEIDLRDLLATLVKHFWLIFGVTLIAAILAFSVSSVLPKTYNVKTTIEIGTAPDQDKLNPIDDPAQVGKKISGEFYDVDIRNKLNISEREYPKISVDNFSGNLLSISVNSPKTQQSESILKELDNAIINDYIPRADQKKAVVLENINIQKKDIEQLTSKAQASEAEKKDIEAEITSLNSEVVYNKDIGLILALTSDRRLLETKQQDIESLNLQIDQSNQQINTMNGLLGQMRPTAIIAGPVVSQAPVSPKILLNTILAALLGFFAGTFLAFGIEWWKRSK
jgi:uncharacterized protein involved in exopolysaccharide biosynthesis